MIERFFKKRDAAQVGMGKMDVAIRSDRLFADAAPDEIGPWAYHGMAPAHDVEPGRQVIDLRMRPGDIGQANVRQLFPVVIKECRSALGFGAHRVIIRQNRRAVIDLLLMSRGDVP